MSDNLVLLPYSYFADPTRAKPLAGGFIYVGEPNLDPVLNPIDIFYVIDGCMGCTVPASNPVIIGPGGIIIYNGTPVQIAVASNYSMRVTDKNNVQAYFTSNNAATGGATVEFVTGNAILHDDLAGAKSRDDVIEGSQVRISDRGNGLFKYVTGAIDNTYSIIDHDTLSLQLELVTPTPGLVAAEWLGAIADNAVTDNADAFQFANDNYDQCVLGSGHYGISTQIALNNLLTGNGKRITFIVLDDNIDGGIIFPTGGVASFRPEGMTIMSRSYFDSAIRDTSGVAIWSHGRPRFKDIEIFGFGDTGLLIPGDSKGTPFRYQWILGETDNCNFQFCGAGIDFDHTGTGSDFTSTSRIKDTYVASCDIGTKGRGLTASIIDNLVTEFCPLGVDFTSCTIEVVRWYFEACATPYSLNTGAYTILGETTTNFTFPPINKRNKSSQATGAFTQVESTGIASQAVGWLYDDSNSPTAETTQILANAKINDSGAIKKLEVENMPSIVGINSTARIMVYHGEGSKGITIKIPAAGGTVFADPYILSVIKQSTGIYEIIFTDSFRLSSASVEVVQEYSALNVGSKGRIMMVEGVAPNNNWTRFRTAPYTITGFRINVTDNGNAFEDNELIVNLIIDEG